MRRSGAWLLALSWGMIGCAVEPRDGHYACNADSECPGGWTCRADGLCYRAPGEVDGGPRVDAGPCDPPCGSGQSCIDARCQTDADGDGAAADVDCDDDDPSMGRTGSRACSSACGSGSETCVDAIWSECDAPPVEDEVCNGLDDDCDGEVDEEAASSCSIPGAIATCTEGRCTIGECMAGRGDCDGDMENGCELDLSDDPDNCGACRRTCAAGASCAAGRCSPIRDVAAGEGHSCAAREDGTVVCWGLNTFGQVGQPAGPVVESPILVEGLTDVIEVTAGQHHTCARQSSGAVLC